jgi:hypothetical protein
MNSHSCIGRQVLRLLQRETWGGETEVLRQGLNQRPQRGQRTERLRLRLSIVMNLDRMHILRMTLQRLRLPLLRLLFWQLRQLMSKAVQVRDLLAYLPQIYCRCLETFSSDSLIVFFDPFSLGFLWQFLEAGCDRALILPSSLVLGHLSLPLAHLPELDRLPNLILLLSRSDLSLLLLLLEAAAVESLKTQSKVRLPLLL